MNERAVALKAEEDALLQEIAALKRTTYTATTERWNESYKTGLEQDEVAWRELKNYKDGDDVDLKISEGVRQARIEGAWRSGVAGLEILSKELPGTMAKLEKARAAEEYVLKGTR